MKITVLSSLLLLVVFVGPHVVQGVQYYSLSYSYFDEVAQAYCAAKVPEGLWAYAVRRRPVGKWCKRICKKLSTRCFNAIHIKKNHMRLKANPSIAQPDAGKIGMESKSLGVRGCSLKGRMPNYCCCMSKKPYNHKRHSNNKKTEKEQNGGEC